MRSAEGGDKITKLMAARGWCVCAVKDDKIVVETSADRVRWKACQMGDLFQRHR